MIFNPHPTVYEVDILIERLERSGIDITPTIIDCGCGVPDYYSNSRKFIQQYGFQALLIDGLESNIEASRQFYANYNNVRCVQAILSDREEDVFFVQDKNHWSLSKIEAGEPNSRTSLLSKIIDVFRIDAIGILSIDLEGNETPVLKELLSTGHLPQVIIIEGNTEELRNQHKEILADRYGYPAFCLEPNQVFILK